MSTEETSTPPPMTRAEKLRRTQWAKLEKTFGGRKFDFVREVHLPRGQVFQNVFGNVGRHGYVIRDRETGEEMIVGGYILRHIHEKFLAVNLPKRRVRFLGREPGSRK